MTVGTLNDSQVLVQVIKLFSLGFQVHQDNVGNLNLWAGVGCFLLKATHNQSTYFLLIEGAVTYYKPSNEENKSNKHPLCPHQHPGAVWSVVGWGVEGQPIVFGWCEVLMRHTDTRRLPKRSHNSIKSVQSVSGLIRGGIGSARVGMVAYKSIFSFGNAKVSIVHTPLLVDGDRHGLLPPI